MAKRPLGLGKASKAKKQKKPIEEKEESIEVGSTEDQAGEGELTVELKEEADADDELAQLQALWNTYFESDRDNELVLNGIVHECDRLLRNSNEKAADESKEGKEEEDDDSLPDFFYAIYALSLAELSNFHPDEVESYFKESLDRIEIGLEKYSESRVLWFAESKILLLKLSLQHVSQLTIDTEEEHGQHMELENILDEAYLSFGAALVSCKMNNDYSLINRETYEFFEILDDLLDIINNFGKHNKEEDDEEEDDDEDDDTELDELHPLSPILEDFKYNQWLKDKLIEFSDFFVKFKYDKTSPEDVSLYRDMSKRIGQWYLREAEIPIKVYTTLTYDDEFEGIEEYEGLTVNEAQSKGQNSLKLALDALKQAQDEDDPETWVAVAECMISLGNLYQLDCKDQEFYYKSAEEILIKANISTNGKYDDILENLLDN
ncbi:Yor051c protein [Scheffersomyces coipomensis]|uniref:Yor051c protein n=1 Tax=Scheffersomyces coipomensis TaxID=1788519 RepID=UPI00315DD844